MSDSRFSIWIIVKVFIGERSENRKKNGEVQSCSNEEKSHKAKEEGYV
jgi:hypothetical protein